MRNEEERRIYLNRSYFVRERIRPMFDWCERCVAAEHCYPDGAGPNFLEPACANGPMTKAEQEAK